MSRRSLWTIGILMSLLAIPSEGNASIWDIIWGMSGPQMMGPVLHCEVDLEYKAADRGKTNIIECRGIDYLFYKEVKPRYLRRVWLSLDSGFYFSTGENSGKNDENEYEAFKNFMVALEPMFEVRSFTSEKWMLNHGLLGLTYDVLAGDKYGTFDNVGFKFRPIGVTFPKKVNASFILRYYPRRFTSEDFGLTNSTQEKNGGEWVWGFSVGWLWKSEERNATNTPK